MQSAAGVAVDQMRILWTNTCVVFSCVVVCVCVRMCQHGVEWVQYLAYFLLSVNGDLDYVCGCVVEAFYARKFAVS